MALKRMGKGLMVAITPGLVLKAKQSVLLGLPVLGSSQEEKSGEKQERGSRETGLAGIWEWRGAGGAGIHRSGGTEVRDH